MYCIALWRSQGAQNYPTPLIASTSNSTYLTILRSKANNLVNGYQKFEKLPLEARMNMQIKRKMYLLKYHTVNSQRTHHPNQQQKINKI